MSLDAIRARIAQQQEAKRAETEQAQQQAATEQQKTADMEARRERVRNALHLSGDKYSALAAEKSENLQSLVAQNKEHVAGAVNEAKSVFGEAAAEGVELSSTEVRDATVDTIKGSTVPGLREARDEMRASKSRSEIISQLKDGYDDMTDDERVQAEQALDNDDMGVLGAIADRLGAVAAEKARQEAAEREANSPEKLMQNMESFVEQSKAVVAEIREKQNEMRVVAAEIQAVTKDAANAVDEKYKLGSQQAWDMLTAAQKTRDPSPIIQRRDQHFADHAQAVADALNTPEGKALVEKYRALRENIKTADAHLNELNKAFGKARESYLAQTSQGTPSSFFEGVINYPKADWEKLPQMPREVAEGVSIDVFNPRNRPTDEYKNDGHSYLEFGDHYISNPDTSKGERSWNKHFSGLNGPSRYNYGINRAIESL